MVTTWSSTTPAKPSTGAAWPQLPHGVMGTTNSRTGGIALKHPSSSASTLASCPLVVSIGSPTVIDGVCPPPQAVPAQQLDGSNAEMLAAVEAEVDKLEKHVS